MVWGWNQWGREGNDGLCGEMMGKSGELLGIDGQSWERMGWEMMGWLQMVGRIGKGRLGNDGQRRKLKWTVNDGLGWDTMDILENDWKDW